VKASAEELPQLQAQAEMIQAQINELSDFVSTEIGGLSKEEDVKLSESQELWNLQQALSAKTEEQERLLPERTQLQIKLQVLEEKLRLKERDHNQIQQELGRIKQDLSTQQQAEKGKLDKSAQQEQQEKLQR